MRIRTFIADSIAEAMAQVREDLGPDAIIISTEEGKRGRPCEVRAAIESPDAAPHSGVDLEDRIRTRLFNEMERELQALKTMRDDMREGKEPQAPKYKDADLVRLLKYHRFAPLAAKPLFNLAKASGKPHLHEAVAAGLRDALPIEPIALQPKKPVMLVGPAGVGKTACVAKLVAASIMNRGRVQCLTTDTLKAGAVEQLRHLCGLMKQTVTACETPEALLGVITPNSFIDTPSVNPFREKEMRDLKAFVSAARAEPVLVLNAGGDAEEMIEVARAFARLGCARMIVTRADAARRFGAVMSAGLEAGLALAQMSFSPYVAEGFKPVTHSDLGTLLAEVPAEFDLPRPTKSHESAA